MKKKGWLVIFLLSLIIFLGSVGTIVFMFMPKENTTKKYIETTTSNKFIDNNADTKKYANNHGVNWTKLLKHNSDVYAWIYVPGTNVDYPVLQASRKETDSFYLEHNIDKKYEFAGSIYSEIQNSKKFTDPVTVLYGHNMKNGSMFASLHKFEDGSFFKKHDKIYIYLPNRRLTYEIYSAYIYDDRHILNSFDFSDKKILKNYQKYTLNPDTYIKNIRKVKLNANSKILTLSTCTNGNNDNTRYIVQGVLVKNEQTK